MNRFARASAACFAVIAGALALGPFAGTAGAAVPCGQRVISDWSNNGRIDRLYQLHCYEEAIEAIPLDLRDYTNAADVIGRALTSALRQQSSSPEEEVTEAEAAPDVDTAGASSLPLPLLLVTGVSLALLAAGALGHLSRRRRMQLPEDGSSG